MNFGSLMYAAQSNASQKQQDSRCYKTTFAPPKKEAPKQRNLSANVQKFLARKEEEKRRKEVEENKKRHELLSLRSQDKMSVKRVSTMLKRTKSANKSVMEDAVDDVNTVVTMAGPSQCDEDDYGYVSQEASSFYNKLMDKYSNMPTEEDKFSKSKKVVIKDLNAAKERVKATLNRIEEEEMLPRKRKRKSKEEKAGGGGEEDDFIDDEIKYRDDRDSKKEEDEPKPKKPKRPPPPPMDFSQLLKIAEQKQYEPVVIEKKQSADDDEDKPMTKKQRLEYLREKEARVQRERRELEDKLRRKPSASASSANKRRSPSPSENSLLRSSLQKGNKSNESSSSISRIPKINQSSESGSRNSKLSSESPAERLQSLKIPKLSDREKAQKTSSSSNSSSKPVPPSVAEEMLKKSSSVWSKPCNLSPSNSPNHKVNSKLSTNENDRRRNSLDNKYTASSNQNLDRRKDTPEKQLIKKPPASNTNKPSSSDLDRRKELNDNIDREKLRKEIERKKLLMKEKLANDRNRVLDRRDEKSNRVDNQPSRKNESSTIVKNGILKNSSIRNDDLQQKSRSNGDIQQKSRLNGDTQQKPRLYGDTQQKSRLNGDTQQKPRLYGDTQQKSRSDSEAQQKSRSDSEAQQKNSAKKGNKVLVDLFGDDFPNEGNVDKSNSNSSSSNKSAVLNGSSKLPGKPNPVKTPSSSSNQSSKNVDSKSKSSISSSQNAIKPPSRQDDRIVSNNKAQPRQFPPNDLKSRSQINDKSRPGDVKPRQFPPADVKPRQFPPADMRPKQFPPPDVRRNSRPVPRRPVNEFIVTDDEDEYDSEMDDFIDDTDYSADVNISKEISQIFGYDKKRYKNIDDDDIEEANFAQMMKEEVRSTRIGIQEDLEEYLRDKAEKKRAIERKLQKLSELKKKRR